MIFGKFGLTKLAASLFWAVVALFVLFGCGGETGGTPSGIGGGLTNAKIRVSSFNLTTTSPINSLKKVGTNLDPTETISGIDGALYPTRNSHSLRVLLKGAGSNREDVTYYIDTYDPSLDPTVAGHVVTPSDYTVHPATVAEPWDLTVAAHDGLPRTEMRRIFFAKRDLGDEVVAVFLTPGTTGQYVYEDDGTAVPAGNTVYAAQSGAFSYSQITASRPVRTGRRNVIVQFFSGTAAAAKTEFETTIPNSTVPSDEETSFLTANLTNSYVFTTNIPPKATDISLTSSFQANNGDNGLVDSGNLTLIAKNLPARWGSVKFEAYEENYGFGKPSIVFSKIVNLTDVQRAGLTGTPTFGEVVAQNQPAPSAVSAAGKDTYNGTTDTQDLTAPGGFPFANRQRVLRIYATCYELPDASGAVLAETRENGTTYNDPAGNFPVQFITTPRAEADVFFPNPGTHNEAAAALANMQLVRSISRVTATVPAIAKGGSQTITVTGLSHTDPRYGYNAVPPGGPSDLTRTLSNAGFVFAIDTVDSLAPFTILPNVLAAPSLPTATSPGGTLTWLGTSTVEFSQNTYTNPAALIQFRPYYPDANNPPYFAAPLLPTQGSGGGVIRGGIR